MLPPHNSRPHRFAAAPYDCDQWAPSHTVPGAVNRRPYLRRRRGTFPALSSAQRRARPADFPGATPHDPTRYFCAANRPRSVMVPNCSGNGVFAARCRSDSIIRMGRAARQRIHPRGETPRRQIQHFAPTGRRQSARKENPPSSGIVRCHGSAPPRPDRHKIHLQNSLGHFFTAV
jgi:hypothetical protein